MTTPTFGSAHAVALALHALLRCLKWDEIARWDDLPELTEEQYRTTNLWGWSGDERPARERANEIVDWFLPPSDLGPLLIIALGNKVADAFGVPRGRTWFEHYVNLDDGFVVVKFPHPSGRNRLWNDPTMRARASFLLETLVTL